MKDYLITIVSFSIVCMGQAPEVSGQSCDMTQAAGCVRAMQGAIDRVMEAASGITRGESLQQLCLDVIKGNNLTQCYIQATGGCGGGEGEVETQTPTPAMQDWEKVMQDLYNLCDGACPNFLEKTINITQCTSLIRFDDLFENSYLSFCRSLNASLDCSSEVSAECPLFSQLFYDLLPTGIDATAHTICTSGCDNFEEALTHLESCKTHVTDLPEDLETACIAYADFRECLQASDVPVTCPIFGALMDVLYPQHIFGLYEEQCNVTTDQGDTADKCGSRGVAKMDHCLRILALAWPVTDNNVVVHQEQCQDFRSAQRCMDNAGLQDCPSLQEYLESHTLDKQSQRALLESSCSAILKDVSSSSAVSVGRHFVRATLMASLGITLLLRCLMS